LSKLHVSFELAHVFAGPSVLVFGNQNMVTLLFLDYSKCLILLLKQFKILTSDRMTWIRCVWLGKHTKCALLELKQQGWETLSLRSMPWSTQFKELEMMFANKLCF